MKQGIVKFFNATKGFVFNKPSDSKEGVFVNETELKEEIRETDKSNT